MAGSRWSELSPTQRRLIVAAAAAEGTMKLAALVDLKRRPAERVKGPKAAWAALVILVNSFGVAPLAYFRYGRRPSADSGN